MVEQTSALHYLAGMAQLAFGSCGPRGPFAGDLMSCRFHASADGRDRANHRRHLLPPKPS